MPSIKLISLANLRVGCVGVLIEEFSVTLLGGLEFKTIKMLPYHGQALANQLDKMFQIMVFPAEFPMSSRPLLSGLRPHLAQHGMLSCKPQN